MSLLAERFAQLRSRGEKALVLFITAGDPSLEALPDILDALQDGGADVIELGIPFSDPIADGPTIQASSQRALDSGVTPTAVLTTLSRCKLRVPLIFMTYYNPVLRRGLHEFAQQAKAAGASGNILTDLTPEEADDWIRESRAAGLDTIFLTAPTSTDERLQEVAKRSSGFIYAVSRTGVTGATASSPEEVASLVARIKRFTELPVCVGFGITNPEHVRTICAVADGAVVGSWLVDKIAREWNGGKGREQLVAEIAALKAATRG